MGTRNYSSRLVATALFMIFTSGVYGQTESPATVPASFVGTYDLSFESFNADSPIATGTQFTMVIGSDNSLCLNDIVLTDPVLVNGNPAEGVWKDEAAGLYYAISNFETQFNEVNVIGAGFSPFYGQMTGSKVSDATDCAGGGSGSESTPTVTEAMNQVFALAESKLSEFFPSGAVTLFFESYVYRYYPDTEVFLAFAEDKVFLLGGPFGGSIIDAGSIATVLSTLEQFEPASTGGGGTSGNADLWNLTVSGTFATSIAGSIPFAGIQITDVPAPDLSDSDEINTQVINSLEGFATGIASLQVTVVTNTETRRVFDVDFSANVDGFGAVTYSLRYDYSR